MQGVLSNLFHVKYEDKNKLLLLSTVFFLAGISEMVNYTSFMALFNSRIGTQYLPQMYVIEAILMPLEGWLLSILVQKVEKGRFMRSLYLFFIAIGLLNSMLLVTFQAVNVFSVAYYIVLFLTSNFVIRQQTWLMWNTAFDLCTTQQAKRLMPLFVLAAIAGGIVAGIITNTLANVIGPELLYVAAMLLLLAGYPFFNRALRLYLRTALIEQQDVNDDEPKQTSSYYLKRTLRSPYLLIVVAIMTLLPAIYFVMEYQYFTVAQAAFSDEKQLTSFYGLMVIVLFSTAFVLQLFTGKLMELLGATNTILAISITFLVGTMLVMLFIHSSYALLIVSAGYSLLYLLLYYFAEPGYQFFFKVLSEEERDGYRYITQSVAASLGILFGSGLSMLHSFGLLSAAGQIAVSALCAILLVASAWYARRLYIKQLVARMRKGTRSIADFAATIAASIDQEQIRATVERLLEHADATVRHFALDVLAMRQHPAWSVILWQYAQRYSGKEKVKALTAISSSFWKKRYTTHLSELEQLLADDREQVRLFMYRQLLAITKAAHDERQLYYLQQALSDSSLFVRAEALLYVDEEEFLKKELEDMLRSEETEIVVLACELVVKRQVTSLLEQVLYCTLSSKPVIKYEAIRTLGHLGDYTIVTSLLEMALDGDKEQQQAIVTALVTLGKSILPQLLPLLTITQLKQWQVVVMVVTELDSDRIYKEQIVAASLDHFQQLSSYVQVIEQLFALASAESSVWLELANMRLAEITQIVEHVIWQVYGYLEEEETSQPLRAALLSGQEDRVDDGLEILAEGYAHPKLSQAMFQYYKANRKIERSSKVQAESIVTSKSSLAISSMIATISDGWLQAIVLKGSGAEGGERVAEHWEYWNRLEQIALLKQVDLFTHLALEELSLLTNIVQEKEVEEGEWLLQFDQSSQPLTIIVEGHVELIGISQEGVKGTLGIVGAMQTVGEAVLFTGEPSGMAAEVILGKAKVLQIESEPFIRLVRLYPAMAVGLLHSLSNRMRTLEKMLVSMG
ncbi:cyclic nucleotide-binding domain-containing protein [Paenibacillus yanchengensis]|uniref:Cyclic nucleotide-binding domain-containing protein n=1 Tax=Paenibacillus yanchengensis TaxID=2035833 RepID=A0ABW4YEM6_9BACL